MLRAPLLRPANGERIAGEGACSIRDARFNARFVCKVTSAYGIGKLHTELTPPESFRGWLPIIAFLGRCRRFRLN